MKYYKLKKDLPTFDAGDLFILTDDGNLWHSTGGKHVDIMAYHRKTLGLFPNILIDWFKEVPAPIRDDKTKHAFYSYVCAHPDERFFQAVRNFSKLYLDGGINFIMAGPTGKQREGDDLYADTFYWECDEMLKEEE